MRRCGMCGERYPSDFLVCPKDATSLARLEASEDDPLVGEVLAGSFCLTGLLGEGGMGRVYEAEHVRFPRRFAVKVMHESVASIPDVVLRFEREAQAIARITSDHVVEVLDILRLRDGRPCIVTELLEGEELGELLERAGKLPISTSITICRQVCSGLAAAHAMGVVHRDLTPSNVFLLNREDGALEVKILDFGLAKVTDGANLTRTGMVVGTPAYMAPEQARGTGDVDVRADVYAVGAVLYRLVTGAPPFPISDPAITIVKVLTEDPPRPRVLDPGIPEGLELLIQRAMARAAEDRPATMSELDRQLARFDVTSPDASVGRPDRGMLAPVEDAAIDAPNHAATRTRLGRSSAVLLALTSGLVAGAAMFVTLCAALRVLSAGAAPTEVDLAMVSAAAGLAAVFVVVISLRALATRWRSGPAVEGIAFGLRRAVVMLLSGVGVSMLTLRGYALLGPPLPREILSIVELGLVAAPTALGAIVLVVALRRAARVT